ncbi:MAG: tRNA epoxyqueuosine(34) reductase QueG [Bacillota bacterium]|nr:tRNA epoxyqueuosine(34) reductase QueG [Bacillota bacterium]
MSKSALISEYIKGLGLSEFGFTRVRYFEDLVPYLNKRIEKINQFEESDMEKRVNPGLYLKEGRLIISIAFPYFFGDTMGDYHFSLYSRGRDYHAVLSDYLDKICSYIKGLGGEAVYFTDSNSLPERYIAKASGVGFIGRNSLVINKRYGSYIFLGEILTDLELEETKIISQDCGSCRKCIDACPSSAIKKDNFNLCISFLTQKKEIEDKDFDIFGGSIFGCDICQKVCPFNKQAEKSNIMELSPISYMENPDIKELLNMDNNTFKKYKITSAGWRGKNILIRNALINAAKKKDENLWKVNISSPYIRDYYYRLLRYFNL